MAYKPFDLTGKVALITGGNGGLGLGMAEGLAAVALAQGDGGDKLGTAAAPTTSSARLTPPSGGTFTTMTSTAPSRAARTGSAAVRIDSSAAIGTETRRLSCASSSSVRQGCSTYSKPPAARSSSRMATTACANDHPPLASTRIRASGTAADCWAERTASTRAMSSSRC